MTLTLSAMANLSDPSLLLSPALSYRVADNAEILAGAYWGLGEAPEFSLDLSNPVRLGSEMGTYGTLAYVQLAAFF